MKNLLIAIFIVLVIAGCDQKKAPDQTNTRATAENGDGLPQLMTLNGISLKDANKMVTDFIANPGTYQSPTSICFSDKFVNSVDSLLTVENGDGFRVYFAKSADGKHTVVIVSTHATLESDSIDPKRMDTVHTDYFEHKASFIATAGSKGVPDYTTTNGALLYTDPKCPVNDKCPITPDYITCETAQQWALNYSADTIITTSEWFPKKEISELNAELISHQKTNNANGIRIYYAKNTDKGGTHRFIFVTTKLQNNMSVDYYDCVQFSLPQKLMGAHDNGEQCPPTCNGVTWPAN